MVTSSTSHISRFWKWRDLDISWQKNGVDKNGIPSVLLIHGFGASKEHWRKNQPVIGNFTSCYAIDLVGFGESSQPIARLSGEENKEGDFEYNFNNWSQQITDFCSQIINRPVKLIGNSIGGIVALKAAEKLEGRCCGVVLIDCAQRRMDDKRIHEKSSLERSIRPLIKSLVRKRCLSQNLFKGINNQYLIKQVLSQAYPSGNNVDKELLTLLKKPAERSAASEPFRGFINLFNDELATDILTSIKVPVDMIWGKEDPWEPVEEAMQWQSKYEIIKSLEIIQKAGHCPHDEFPNQVNAIILKLIQQAT